MKLNVSVRVPSLHVRTAFLEKLQSISSETVPFAIVSSRCSIKFRTSWYCRSKRFRSTRRLAQSLARSFALAPRRARVNRCPAVTVANRKLSTCSLYIIMFAVRLASPKTPSIIWQVPNALAKFSKSSFSMAACRFSRAYLNSSRFTRAW